MKCLLLFLGLYAFLANVNAQKDSVTAPKLIDLYKSHSVEKISTFVRSINYKVLDSSVKNGYLFFYSCQMSFKGDYISIGGDKNGLISQLTFGTTSREKYLQFKNQLKGLGFISRGLKSGDLGSTIETEDFYIGKLLVSTAEVKQKEDRIYYEFWVLELEPFTKR